MKNLFLVLGILSLMACDTKKIEFAGLTGASGVSGTPGIGCSAVRVDGGVNITCGSNDPVFVADGAAGETGQTGTQGPQGGAGDPGSVGQNGHSAVILTGVADGLICPAGGTIIDLGIDLNDNGLLDEAESTNVAVVCNGLNGQNGNDGLNAPPTPFTPVTIIMPCAKEPMKPTVEELADPFLEVLLGFQNGMVFTSFSEDITGYNTHFAILSPGTYVSTGRTNCAFTVQPDGTVIHYKADEPSSTSPMEG